jgi:hypothetical protein
MDRTQPDTEFILGLQAVTWIGCIVKTPVCEFSSISSKRNQASTKAKNFCEWRKADD